ncbi:MAG: hypothetical protein ACOVME_07205, partial [Rhodobacter sp.]
KPGAASPKAPRPFRVTARSATWGRVPHGIDRLRCPLQAGGHTAAPAMPEGTCAVALHASAIPAASQTQDGTVPAC